MNERVIPVIYGSVRTERKGIRAARFVVNEVNRRGYHAVLVDPLEHMLPLLDRLYKEYAPNEAPPALKKLAELFTSADGFVVVSGEYNHGVPPALKNLMDHFLEEYFWRPAAIVSYSGGPFGGVRAAIQWRSILGEMGMITIPSIQPFPRVQAAFTDDGEPTDPQTRERTARFFEEFAWYIDALREQRRGGVPYSS
jgi:NAD(P)H-dependent FMN reductase